MTVENQTNKVTANGNGVATVFSFSPVVLPTSSADLVVTHVDAAGVETVLTEGAGASNYSVSVSTFPGTGSITYPASGGSPLPTGEKLVMNREVNILQEVDLFNQGGYFPEVQEGAFDLLTIIALQQQEELDRAVKVTIGSTVDPADLIAGLEADADAAAASAAAAATSETNAAASETAASKSEKHAAASRAVSEASVGNAFGYAIDAGNSATAAAISETNAATSAAQASNKNRSVGAMLAASVDAMYQSQTSASAASTSETNAATSESNAATSESNASTSETNAATSETNAATSETNAAASEVVASYARDQVTAFSAIASNAQKRAKADAAAAASSAASVDFFNLFMYSQVFG